MECERQLLHLISRNIRFQTAFSNFRLLVSIRFGGFRNHFRALRKNIKMMKNIFITGGSGFIGSNLALKLISKRYNITVLDNLSPQIHGDNPKETLHFF